MENDKTPKLKNEMDKMWFELKSKGFFRDYDNPDEYRKAKKEKARSILILDKN